MLKKSTIYLNLKENYTNLTYKKNSAFFGIFNENHTIQSFIKHIIKEDFLGAKTLISKYSRENLDIETLKDFFNEDFNYKILKKVLFNKKNYEKINSFMIIDKNLKFKGIINFHMISEPDNFSKWKIYKIEYNF